LSEPSPKAGERTMHLGKEILEIFH